MAFVVCMRDDVGSTLSQVTLIGIFDVCVV